MDDWLSGAWTLSTESTGPLVEVLLVVMLEEVSLSPDAPVVLVLVRQHNK